MLKVKRIQRFWRKRGEIITNSRAKELLDRAKKGVLSYKMLIDKERMELEAKKKIVRAFRHNMIKQKLIRYSICARTSLNIIDEAWEAIREN
jgi:hypothetical protein